MASPTPVRPVLEPEIRQPSTISLPTGFEFNPVPVRLTDVKKAAPSLGPLAAFVGDWSGHGFNTIFRPDSSKTPTVLPVPVTGSDNILELNLTTENLSFSASLGAVPNRGFGSEADVFLNGVPYLQAINDVTLPNSQPTGIHLEPGMWVVVPSTTNPAELQTVARMASIPHGTTVQAQGTSAVIAGPPTIPPVDITPFVTATNAKIKFPSQTVINKTTPRIPQDLTGIAITQAMLDDPNSVLRNAIAGQKITSTTVITVSTAPTGAITGGGTDNIAFLQNNALSAKMTATFWIETVEHSILIPVFRPGQGPLILKAQEASPSGPSPTFSVTPPIEITAPRTITFKTTQIQYSQTVNLNFNGLTWPHVSVATLVPSNPIVVPPSAWT